MSRKREEEEEQSSSGKQAVPKSKLPGGWSRQAGRQVQRASTNDSSSEAHNTHTHLVLRLHRPTSALQRLQRCLQVVTRGHLRAECVCVCVKQSV